MATSFTPKFVDLVRCTSSTVGTGNLVLGAAVAGFVPFAGSVVAGERFYYSVAGIDKPAESEVGRGTMMADGSIAREAMSGTLTSFTTGQKTVSLVAGAEWFRKAEASAIDPATLPTRDKSNIAAALTEVTKLAPLFSELGTTRVPLNVRRIETAGRTVLGVAPATYIRDPDQSANTVIGQALVNALPTAAQAAAVSAISAILDRVRAKDADGQYWVIDDDGCQVYAGHFGAIADGYYNETTGAMSGTDNAPAIQALIDWRVYLRATTKSANKDVLIPPGQFRISNMIELGYGDTFRKVVVRGVGISYVTVGGTSLLADFDDRPALVIQGGRYSGVEELALVSKGRAWVNRNNLGSAYGLAQSAHGIDDRDITKWHDPSRPARAALLRYNPCAAIAVDPFGGVQPGPVVARVEGTDVAQGQYYKANGNLYIARVGGTLAAASGPTATGDLIQDGTAKVSYVGPDTLATSYSPNLPPAFLPAAARIGYGRNAYSSVMTIRNVGIAGFSVGIAVQPADIDGNGDFLRVYGSFCSETAIPVSIGQTQARNNHFSQFDVNTFHTALSGKTHGRQAGRVEGTWIDCSFTSGMRLLETQGQGARGTVHYVGCYGEAVYSLGSVDHGGSTGDPTIFRSCTFSFFGQSAAPGGRGVPHSVFGRIDGQPGSGNTAQLLLDASHFTQFQGFFTVLQGALDIKNTLIAPDDVGTAVVTVQRARALNTTAGGIVTPMFGMSPGATIIYNPHNETALGGSNITAATGERNKTSSHDYPASIYTSSLTPLDTPATQEAFFNPKDVGVCDATAFSRVALSGRTLTLATADSPASLRRQGLWKGAVLHFAATSHFFLVDAIVGATTSTITATLQNGFRVRVDASVEMEIPFTGTTGAIYWAGGGVYTPRGSVFADVTNSSATFGNVTRGDGYGSFSTDGPVKVGDYAYALQYVDCNFAQPFDLRLNSVTGSPGSVVFGMSSATSGLNQARKRLPLWVSVL